LFADLFPVGPVRRRAPPARLFHGRLAGRVDVDPVMTGRVDLLLPLINGAVFALALFSAVPRRGFLLCHGVLLFLD
jgi:hypothetical protein